MKRIATIVAAFLFVLLAASGKALGSSNLLTNGDFSTGDFTGWTIFTTPSGSLGGDGYPFVSSFNPTNFAAPDAAGFNVGSSLPGVYQGGGVYQDFTSGAGLYNLIFWWAAYSPPTECCNNPDGGEFSLVLDGQTATIEDTGYISIGETIWGGSGINDVLLSAGTHQFGILITRPYATCGYDCTPEQFVTGASVSPVYVPEPGSLILLGSGLLSAAGFVRRKRS
jgi:hypothetical protein